jgi:hypothetical protein
VTYISDSNVLTSSENVIFRALESFKADQVSANLHFKILLLIIKPLIQEDKFDKFEFFSKINID